MILRNTTDEQIRDKSKYPAPGDGSYYEAYLVDSIVYKIIYY